MELNGLKSILGNIKNVIKLPKSAHIEGGDVIVTKDHVFIGYYNKDDYKNQITARTNKKAIRTLKELVKINEDRENNIDAAIEIMNEALVLAPNFNMAELV